MAQRLVQPFLPLMDTTCYIHSCEQESPDGFVVNGEAYETVVVTLTSAGEAPEIGPTFLEVERSLIPKSIGPRTNPYRRARVRVGLADVKRLKKHVLGGLSDGRRLNRMRVGSRRGLSKIAVPEGLEKEITHHVQRLQMVVNPVVLEAQAAAYRTTRHFPKVMQYQEFYRDRFLVQDLLSYRAARVAVLYAPRFAEVLLRSRNPRLPGASGKGTVRLARARRVISAPGVEMADPRPLLSGLRNWRVLLSPNGKSYRALNLTLDHLPRSVPVSLILELHRVKLPRPIEDRAEFLLITAWSASDRHQRNPKAFTHSRRPEIEKAFSIVANHVGQGLSPDRIRDVRFFVSFLMDSRAVHLGGLTGLAKKAVDWHVRLARRQAVSRFRGLGPLSTRLAEPPIPVPQDPRIRFLANLADLADEATVMKHCVASYASRAIRGKCFLFHVSYQGDEATVEVSPRGYVVQSQGPGNRRNQASRWGESHLRRWAAAFPVNQSLEGGGQF